MTVVSLDSRFANSLTASTKCAGTATPDTAASTSLTTALIALCTLLFTRDTATVVLAETFCNTAMIAELTFDTTPDTAARKGSHTSAIAVLATPDTVLSAP